MQFLQSTMGLGVERESGKFALRIGPEGRSLAMVPGQSEQCGPQDDQTAAGRSGHFVGWRLPVGKNRAVSTLGQRNVHTINAANTESREWFRITGVVEIVGVPRDAQQANAMLLAPMGALPPAQPISPMARAASITSTAMAIATCTIMPIWIGPRRGTGSVGPKVLEVLNDRNR